jgi:hypothetical protein
MLQISQRNLKQLLWMVMHLSAPPFGSGFCQMPLDAVSADVDN